MEPYLEYCEPNCAFAHTHVWRYESPVKLALERLRKKIVNLPQPTLGKAGGVDRKAVLAEIDKILKGEQQ